MFGLLWMAAGYVLPRSCPDLTAIASNAVYNGIQFSIDAPQPPERPGPDQPDRGPAPRRGRVDQLQPVLA